MAAPTSVFAEGNTALITGGASGVGLAVAKLCYSHGMRLALVDYNSAALEEVQSIFQVNGRFDSGRVSTYSVDVRKLESWTELKSKVEQEFGSVEFLMLNAGVHAKGTWGDADYFDKILSTNLFGVINGLNTFVPVIKAQNQDKATAIVITGSKQGITNPPGNPAYNASKAAVKSLAEHLSWDFKGTKTSVHLLVPGWTWTGLTQAASGGTEKPEGAWAPEQVADYMYEKMSAEKFYIICPDNDVTEADDRKRIAWAAEEIVGGRPPLSRWREEGKADAAEWMAKQDA